uniref:Ovule protein n=1 Tax=Panagrellus redivivus TaxID=6233 RepID=A0A7E4W6F5_PANRE
MMKMADFGTSIESTFACIHFAVDAWHQQVIASIHSHGLARPDGSYQHCYTVLVTILHLHAQMSMVIHMLSHTQTMKYSSDNGRFLVVIYFWFWH